MLSFLLVHTIMSSFTSSTFGLGLHDKARDTLERGIDSGAIHESDWKRLAQAQLLAQTEYSDNLKRQPLTSEDSLQRFFEAEAIAKDVHNPLVAAELTRQLYDPESKAKVPYMRKKRNAQVKREAVLIEKPIEKMTDRKKALDIEIQTSVAVIDYMCNEMNRLRVNLEARRLKLSALYIESNRA